jgi:CubicO group peptidase (beta-lactamase class C family)
MSKGVALVLGVALLLGSAVAGRQPATARLQASLKAVVDSGGTPSIAAAIGRDGRIVWSGAAGWADVERKVPATASTPYSLASISKPFTATAVMVLRERRLIDLGAPVSRYLGLLTRPGVKDAERVTVDRLLRHVAGFPTHYQFFYDDEKARPLPLAERLHCYGVEVHTPGDRYNYSNLGYGVLGELVSRVAGVSYGEALARDVLRPLGLNRTFVPERAEDVASAAVRYANDGQPLPFYVTDHPAGSEVYSSAEDLVRFGLFHAGVSSRGQAQVLSEASRDAMRKPGAGNYGLGWSINPDWNGRLVQWHGGGMPGVSTALWVVPSDRLSIAVVANAGGVPVHDIAGELVEQLLQLSPRSSSGAGNQKDDGGRSSLPASLKGRWRGTLAGCAGGDTLAIDIRAAEAATLAVNGGEERPMHSISARDGRFAATGRATDARFTYQFDLRHEGPLLVGSVRRTTSLGTRGSNSVTLPLALERLQ